MADFHPLRTRDHVGSVSWDKLNKIAEQRAKDAPSASMPILDHIPRSEYLHVYEPADDTFLLIDALNLDLASDDQIRKKTSNILEIGCGSGVPVIFAGKLLKDTFGIQASLTATDINPKALQVARDIASANGVGDHLETIQCDLVSSLVGKKVFDLIIFNPPYVPTPDEEVQGNGIEASWAGGQDGRRVVDRAISQIPHVLAKPHGYCYMITVDDNKPEDLCSLFRSVGLSMEPFLRRRAYNEYLTVQKISWNV